MSRARLNHWFVEGEGIAREVITADIQRYLGNDAVVWPGTSTEGIPGYWVKAYRTLTSEMIRDLQADSKQWEDEKRAKLRQEAGRGVEYQDSQTHASRQHWGPSQATSTTAGREPARTSASSYAQSPYSTDQPAYTTTPTAQHSTHQASYPVQPTAYTAPRTAPADPYTYNQPSGGHPGYSNTPQGYYNQPQTDPYRQQAPPPPQHTYAQPRTAAPGYYIASDGNQYPLPQQQPQQQPPQPSGRPRRTGS